MNALNKVTLIGNVGEDPKKEFLKDGTPVARFSVATSDSWKDKATGDRKSQTEWHRVVIWNDKLVDLADRYIRKGTKLYLEGKLQTRKWTDKDGQERSTTEVVLPKFGGTILLLTPSPTHPKTEETEAFLDDSVPF